MFSMASDTLDKREAGNEETISIESPDKSQIGGKKRTYDQILKSTTLVGGSSVLNIFIAMVRSKAIAALLGPAGFGLMGLYTSVASLTQSIVGMGVNSSGVRQIAESVGSGDAERIGRTATALRRTSLLLGALGSLFLVIFSRQLSALTFGGTRQAGGICLLSAAVFFQLVSAGQGALIQGLRRIGDLAKISVFGALFGTLLTIPLVYYFREKGVVPSLVGVAVVTLITSWWYSHKIQLAARPMTTSEVAREATDLLKLGFAFMVTGMMTIGSAYAVRIIVLHQLGLVATGIYQSAWTVGGLYVGFILQAMAADFYPRLTANANDHDTCNRLVNEQAQVGLLLAGPGVLATLTFASLLIPAFYSPRFMGAAGILRWICLGSTLQVISWPMGFIIVAKNDRLLFIVAELLWTIVHISLAWICMRLFGLDGAGMAFFGSYVFHVFLVYAIVRRRTGFRWSPDNLQTVLLFGSLIAVVFCGSCWLSPLIACSIGTFLTIFGLIYSTRFILRLVSLELLPRQLQRFMAAFGLARSEAL